VPYLLLAEYVRIAPTRCDIEQKFERIALGVILVCLWIADVNEDAVAHVFGHEPTEVAHRLSNAFLIAVMTSRRSSGSMRAESTVEPTRSEKALGGVPRAASTAAGPGVGAALAYGRCIDRAAQNAVDGGRPMASS
jgi:hypothetical protein